jgi:hypothetical protein
MELDQAIFLLLATCLFAWTFSAVYRYLKTFVDILI